MTSRNLFLVTDARLDAHTVAALSKRNTATSDATLIVQQAAGTLTLSSCIAKIVEMLVSRPVRKMNRASPQQVHNKSTSSRTDAVWSLLPDHCDKQHHCLNSGAL